MSPSIPPSPPSPSCSTLTLLHSSLEKKKKELLDALKTAKQSGKEEDLELLQRLHNEMKAGMEELEELLGRTSLETAERILGKERIMGRKEDYEHSLDFSPDISPVSFSRKELESFKDYLETNSMEGYLIYEATQTPEGIPPTLEEMAKKAGDNVIEKDTDGAMSYRLYKDQFNDDGTIKDAAWFANDESITKAAPDGGWKLVSKDILPNSANRNYIDQNDFLIEHWKTHILPDLPEKKRIEAEAVFTQWESDKPELRKKVKAIKNDTTRKIAADALASHPVTKLLCESLASTILRTILLQKTQNVKILPTSYSWSSTPSSGGSLASFGHFDPYGAAVRGYDPRYEWTNNGAVFSRR